MVSQIAAFRDDDRVGSDATMFLGKDAVFCRCYQSDVADASTAASFCTDLYAVLNLEIIPFSKAKIENANTDMYMKISCCSYRSIFCNDVQRINCSFEKDLESGKIQNLMFIPHRIRNK